MAPTRLEFALLAFLCAGCEGLISNPNGSAATGGSGSEVSHSGGASAVGGAAIVDPGLVMNDVDNQAKDPLLFDIATKYFPGQSSVPGKKRLFRLTRSQLDATTQSLLPEHYNASAVRVMPRDPLQTNYEYAENLAFKDVAFTPFTGWVDAMTEGVQAAPGSIVGCAAQDSACLQSAAQAFVIRAFRGIASEEQLSRYGNFFSASVAAVGVPAATADLVNVTLTSPGYVFREEVQTDKNQRLLPTQLLQNLTYSLADAPPEAVGLTSLSRDAAPLSDADIAKAVDLVLATSAARAKLLRFFMAWLEVKEPTEFLLDAGTFPEFTPAVAAQVVEDTRAFLERQLSSALPTLKDVTLATQAIVGQPSAFLFGLAKTTSGPVELDPAQRVGIFTQPGVIASHSGPTTSRLVKRGVFFTRKVMCLPLGVPPPDVNLTIPATATGTERERIATTTQPARCQGCHAMINPFGFMQESYDAMGRYRTSDAGKPVDASISIPAGNFLDEGALSTTTSVEALRVLTKSARFQQCFTRQLFRFYSGRDEEAGDDPLLRSMFFEFANQDAQSITTMLRTLATSSHFSARSKRP